MAFAVTGAQGFISLSKPDRTWGLCAPMLQVRVMPLPEVVPSRSGDFLCRLALLARQEDGLLVPTCVSCSTWSPFQKHSHMSWLCRVGRCGVLLGWPRGEALAVSREVGSVYFCPREQACLSGAVTAATPAPCPLGGCICSSLFLM